MNALLIGAAAGIALLIGVYQTGVSAERKRGEAAGLRAAVETMKRQQDAALTIQTRMAERMAQLRLAAREREETTDEIIAGLRARPAAAACLLSDAERLQLRSIAIGRARTNPRSR